jgi:hypothetical protein
MAKNPSTTTLYKMKIANILSLLISFALASAGRGSESEVLEFVSSDGVASRLVTDFDFFPKIFAQVDSQSKDETQQNNRYFTTYTLLAASSTKDSEIPSQGWSHWVEVKIEKSASDEFMNVRAVSFTALRRGDSWPCFFTGKVIRLNNEGEVVEVLASEIKPSEQVGATQYQSKPEGSDKPPAEAEGRSR